MHHYWFRVLGHTKKDQLSISLAKILSPYLQNNRSISIHNHTTLKDLMLLRENDTCSHQRSHSEHCYHAEVLSPVPHQLSLALRFSGVEPCLKIFTDS